MTQSNPFPLTLEQVLFTRTSVTALQDHNPQTVDATIIPENQLDVQRINDDPPRYLVTMKCKFNLSKNPSCAYSIDMECLTTFVADPATAEEEAHKAATITGHSVLYGAIRETVAYLTSRQPWGTFLLGLSVLRPQTPTDTPSEP